MELAVLAIDKLIVNRANDRHGELENETAAIGWLFNNHEQQMKNLARDIALKGEVYEPPLVYPENSHYTVFDGNRRVTCFKLIRNPRRAPTVELQEYFEQLREKSKIGNLESLQCQCESDREKIDEILLRRHTGSQGGIGQLTWDDRMKSNFIDRTGRDQSINVAAEIEKLLETHGMAPKARIPRSNLNRLLSSEAFRSRVGITVRERKLEFTHQPEAVLPALARIASDFAEKRKVLDDVWDIDKKRSYLNSLETAGLLPTASQALKLPQSSTPASLPPKLMPVVRPMPTAMLSHRFTLIPQHDYAVAWSGKLQRHHSIWQELQFKLQLRDHPNAIAVLFRVLLELAIENYIEATGLHSISQNDKLKNKFDKVVADLYRRDKITEKYQRELQRVRQGQQLLSIDSLNSYVHSKTFAPAPADITALWDTLSNFVILCLAE